MLQFAHPDKNNSVSLTIGLAHAAGSPELITSTLVSVASSTSLLEPEASSCPSCKCSLGSEDWKQTFQ